MFFIKKFHFPTNIFLLLSIISIGVLLHEGHSRFLYSNSLNKYVGHKVVLIGDVAQPVEITEDRINLIIHTEKVITDKVLKVNGLVLVNIKKEKKCKFEYGDKVQFRGKLKLSTGLRNPCGFDYQKYLARKKIHIVVWIYEQKEIVKLGRGKFNPIFMFAYKIRDKASSVIYKILPDKPFACASLLDGVLLGKRSQLPDEVEGWFRDTGTIHILAISGFNVGLIGLIFFFIFHRLICLPKRTSSIFTLFVLIIFAIVTGASPSVVRAVIMAGTIIIGLIIDRETNIYHNLALAALLVLLHNPLTLFDIGFQLSFVAVFSLFYFTPFIEPKLWFLPKYLAKLIATSVAVQIGLSPILIFYFNKLSLITVLANIIVVPLVSIILILGLAIAFIGMIFIPLANLIGIATSYIITSLLVCVFFFARIPYAYIYLATPTFFDIGSYYLILWAITRHKRIGTTKVIIGILILINIFLWTGGVVKNSSRIMKVTFLDVGQGDAIFLEFPEGSNMLIDGGPSGFFDAGERIILPFLTSKGILNLDVVIVSHNDIDHYGGLLSVLKNFKVRKFVLSNGIENQELSRIIKEKGICHKVVKRGDKISGYPGIEIYILHPSDIMAESSDNNNSVVVKILFNKISFLFAGDIEKEAQKKLLPFKEMLSAMVLKIPHHGSRNAYYSEFITEVNPEIGIIQVGRDNRFNFPHKEVIAGYEKIGTKIYQTDIHGAVTVKTDGEKIWVKTIYFQ
ncbi:MAG: DNA internalization-related competence protein ComEC/Rec2 [bacterium]